MSAQHEQSMPGPKSKQTRRLRSGSAPRRRVLPGPAGWQRRLVEQVASASGATRVLFLRENAAGPVIVASHLPPGEDGAALHAAITPWLDEARRTRHARLRHGPADAAAADQRSCIVAPLVGDGVLGHLYADIDGASGRFQRADCHLLAAFADAAAASLGRERAKAETEQRAAELAIINAVQRALAGKLDIQGVYDAVGDKLREVFPRSLEGIRIVDRAAGRFTYPYAIHGGKRVYPDPLPITDRGFSAEVIRSRRTLLANEDIPGVSARLGSVGVIFGQRSPKSLLLVPLIVAGEVFGMLCLNDMEREQAFSADDVRLLETLAASMGVALENARLFDETQRLLKETEQRNAELAVINGIQQGVSAKLDFQAIVDLVGDTLREVFATGDLLISWRDEPARTRRIPLFSASTASGTVCQRARTRSTGPSTSPCCSAGR